MHRFFIAFCLVSLAGLATTGPVHAQAAQPDPGAVDQPAAAQPNSGAAQPDTGQPNTGQPAPAESAGEGTPPVEAAPASSCQGMIAPGDLLGACEARLDSDTEWRDKIGTRLGRSILQSFEPRPDTGDKPSPSGEPWLDDLITQVTYKVHEREAKLISTNNRHVIMAYAVLWSLLAVFLAFMWVRQKSLKDEIARLRREVDSQAKD